MRRPTLGHTFLLAALAVALVVGAGFFAFVHHARESILVASERLRESTARRIEGRVTESLHGAEGALEHVEQAVASGAVKSSDPSALEAYLYTELAHAPRLEEVTFTGATLTAYTAAGEAVVDSGGRFQVSVFRTTDGTLRTRVLQQKAGRFVVFSRDRGPKGPFDRAPLVESGAGADPTEDPTFSVIAAERNRGRHVWSDLHYAELDRGQPNPRVVLSVQGAVADDCRECIRPSGSERFLGVARAGLLTSDLDAIARVTLDGRSAEDPHRVALLAVSTEAGARLVARVGPDDRIQEFGDELRVVPVNPPKEIAALLASPLVHGLDPDHPNASGALSVEGARYLATLRELSTAGAGTQGWFVAVLVPEAYYTAELVRFEHTFLLVFGATLALVIAIGATTLNRIRRGLGEVVGATSRMRSFDFEPAANHSSIREIDEVMVGLERAKTVARAMGKYIPLDLVRRLYETNQEPELGGELVDVSLMFTDIEGFTTLSEKLPPDELSRRLGDYLEAMTTAVQRTSGTIDKYIGDAVMAFWNAPVRTEGHAAKACEAVLACKEATAALYASPVWHGLPPLVTRYGVHRARVMVGHFGARTRLSYTALGDGVNLAARLEPLCKQYGVTALVSDAVMREAGTDFVFRRIDRVAVKGKTQAIDVYELLGRRGEVIPGLARVECYENAFRAYLARDFRTSIDLLETQIEDAPSRILLDRCRTLLEKPPSAEWNGVHVAASK